MQRNKIFLVNWLVVNWLIILTTHHLPLTNIFAQEQFIYDAKGKRDPFIPLVTPDGRLLKLEEKEGIAGLLLEGIIYDDGGLSYAIINGEVVKAGDTINAYQVREIGKDKVFFIKDGQPVELELKKGEE